MPPVRALKVALASMLCMSVLVCVYLCQYTALPVYLLDKLNLRPFFLPNILCDNCTYITEVSTLLSNASAVCPGHTLLLTVVISFHANLQSRKAIRETWGGVREYKGQQIRTVFAFGVHTDKNMNEQLFYEQGLYHDILQVDMADHYRNLTRKTLLVLRWVHRHCPHVRYILKTDDDSFNNVPRIADYLLLGTQERFVGGYCFTVMPDRSPSSKYYVPYQLYPDIHYPTYCAGPGYILSHAAMDAILEVQPNVAFLPMEDVYITGMCRQAAHLHYTNIPGMVVGEGQLQKCDMATWAKNTHNVIPERMRDLWKRVIEANTQKHCLAMYIKDIVFIVFMLVIWGKILATVFR